MLPPECSLRELSNGKKRNRLQTLKSGIDHRTRMKNCELRTYCFLDIGIVVTVISNIYCVNYASRKSSVREGGVSDSCTCSIGFRKV